MAHWTDEEKDYALNRHKFIRSDWPVIAAQLNKKFDSNRTADAVRKQIYKLKKGKVEGVAEPKAGINTVLVYADIHYPFDDPDSVAIMMMIAKDIKPDMIVAAGDLLENYDKSSYISRIPKKKIMSLDEERELVKNHLRIMRNNHPNVPFHYLGANHEDRLLRYLAVRAPELLGLPELQIPELLDLKTLNIIYHEPVNKESYVNFGNLLVGHWDSVYCEAGYTAKNLVAKKGMSLIQAHTHRVGVYSKTWVKRQVVGVECGCLCTLTPEYKENPNWQHGFAIINFAGKYFSIDVVQIVKTEEGLTFAICGGKMYQMQGKARAEGEAGMPPEAGVDRRVSLQ